VDGAAQGVAWRQLFGAGSGFTVALFIIRRVFADKRLPVDITFVRALNPTRAGMIHE